MLGLTRTARCWPWGRVNLGTNAKKKEEQIAADILSFPSCMGFFHGYKALEAYDNIAPIGPKRPTPLPQWSTVQQEAKLL